MMKMKLAAAAAALALGSAAFADTSTTTTVFKLNAGLDLYDEYSFSVSGPSTVTGDTNSSGVSWMDGVVLTPLSAPNPAVSDPNPDDGFTFAGLSAGSYLLSFIGQTFGRGAYGGYFTVTTAAVPEPTTSLLMLAGLGAFGFLALRRRG